MVCAMNSERQNGLSAQFRVLTALILRETATRFGRSSAGYLWAVAEPAGFIALLSIVFSQFAHDPPYGRSFPMFYATGYLAYSLFSDMARMTARSVMVNRPLLAFPPVTALDTVLARFVLQLVTWLAASAIIIAAILWFFAEPVQVRISALLQLVALGALLGLGMGLCNTILFSISKTWELIFELITRPLFLISAIFFSFESLPLAAREILWWNPIIHLVGLMRQGFYAAYDGGHVSVAYLLVTALGLILTGLTLLTRFGNRLAEA